jgi:hypothetical protein
VDAQFSATLSVHDEPRSFPVCSEALLGTAMLNAGLGPEDFAKVGMRGLMCKSDGCVAIFDMRPTSSGGGMYAGATCLSLADMIKLAVE